MLHEFLTAQREEIIARTREKVATRPAPPPTKDELEHGVPLFLAQLVDTLRSEQETTARATSPAMAQAALLHGAALRRAGFTVGQVVHDYGNVCQAVTELAIETHSPISSDEFKTLNRCLDEAIAHAVTEFSRVPDEESPDPGTRRLGFLTHELRNLVRLVRLQRERQQLAQRASVSERLAAVGAMAAGLAHEIRNPLNAAQLQLGVAERRLARATATDVSSALECLALVREEMGRLNRIVEGVLDFARPADLRPVRGDLSHTVATTARFLEPEVASNGVVLHVAGIDAPLELRFDEGRIKQVLVNLIQNAAEAAGPGGDVWVSVRRQAQMVELWIEDSGPGVPPGVDPFIPFFTTKDRGTGLGLPTAHRILAEHGGMLFFARTAEERTAFVAQLPVSPA